jgi:hypothetical protein
VEQDALGFLGNYESGEGKTCSFTAAQMESQSTLLDAAPPQPDVAVRTPGPSQSGPLTAFNIIQAKEMARRIAKAAAAEALTTFVDDWDLLPDAGR